MSPQLIVTTIVLAPLFGAFVVGLFGRRLGDTVSMTMNLGYLVSTAIFLAALVVLAGFQVLARKFHPFLYWATIIASTTAGGGGSYGVPIEQSTTPCRSTDPSDGPNRASAPRRRAVRRS